jgi:hypothetical protein
MNEQWEGVKETYMKCHWIARWISIGEVHANARGCQRQMATRDDPPPLGTVTGPEHKQEQGTIATRPPRDPS